MNQKTITPHPTHNMTPDFLFMQQALKLAEQGLGHVAPNPSVGCVIVKNGVILGQARSADGGRPHAETQALAQAGNKAQGADLYVTLEPCGHHGVTPPCVDAIIQAKIKRVIMACQDPNQHDHHCIQRLESAGITVTQGVCEQKAVTLNEGFFKVITEQRPLVTAKIATTLDGKIATSTGESQWITGEESRQAVHQLRACHDAVLVGVGTILADNPKLTVRHPDYKNDPIRIVIDRDLRTPITSHILQNDMANKTWLFCGEYLSESHKKPFQDAGATLLSVNSQNSFFAPATLLKTLATQGITRLMIEGGGRTLTGFLQAGMIDRLFWFRAPKIMGGDGMNAIQPLNISKIDETLHFQLEKRTTSGQDTLEIWIPERTS